MQAAMGRNRTLANLSARGSPLLRMFSNSTGKLQRHLRNGEFAMFKQMPVFESDFIQISKRGHLIDVHNSVQVVTVGIAYSTPSLAIPDIMLLARSAGSRTVSARKDPDTKGRRLKAGKSLELTRLLPLKFVKISIHSSENKQLRIKLATGRSFYLQMCPTADGKQDQFAQWEDLVFFLRPPVEAYSNTQAEPVGDMIDIPVLEAEDKRSPEAMEVYGEGYQDQVSIRSLPMGAEMSGATCLAQAAGEGAQPHASRIHCVLRSIDCVLTTAHARPERRGSTRGGRDTSQQQECGRGRDMTSMPDTEISESPGAGLSISAIHRTLDTQQHLCRKSWDKLEE